MLCVFLFMYKTNGLDKILFISLKLTDYLITIQLTRYAIKISNKNYTK